MRYQYITHTGVDAGSTDHGSAAETRSLELLRHYPIPFSPSSPTPPLPSPPPTAGASLALLDSLTRMRSRILTRRP